MDGSGVARVTIHRLARSKKALDACTLVESLYERGARTVVWFSDAGRAGVFDQYLWTFAQYSFVPHAVCSGGDVDEPVAIVTGAVVNPNRAEVLVVVDRMDRPADVEGFAEIHDFDAGTDEDAGKAEAWRVAGFQVDEVTGVRL